MNNFDELVKIQNQIRQKLIKEESTDKKITILSLINELTSGPKEIVQKESLIIEATKRGISEDDVDKIIEQLKKDNVIFESKPGYIEKR